MSGKFHIENFLFAQEKKLKKSVKGKRKTTGFPGQFFLGKVKFPTLQKPLRAEQKSLHC